jgi:hypothetical protein
MNFDIDELLSQGKVPSQEQLLPADFKARFNLGPVHQLGLAVPSVLEAAHRYEESGIGPFFIAEDDMAFWVERGENKFFHGKVGVADFGGYELELLEPGRGSTIYAEALQPEGKIALHHLGFLDHNIDQRIKQFSRAGFETAVWAKEKTGPFTFEVAYMDARKDTGVYVEFCDYRLFKIPIRLLPSLTRLGARLLRLFGVEQLRLGQYE